MRDEERWRRPSSSLRAVVLVLRESARTRAAPKQHPPRESEWRRAGTPIAFCFIE
jgi:hypothetical protein